MNTFLSSLKSLPRRAYAWMKMHKAVSALVIIVLLSGAYATYANAEKASSGTEYVIGAATRGTISVDVTGSGQVEANQTLDLSPKSSGEVTYVGVKAGDQVAAGTLIASVDDTDAEKTLRDAETSLTSAKISYQQSVTSAGTDTTSALGTAFSSAATVLADLPTILNDIDTNLRTESSIPGHQDQENEDAYAAIIGGTTGDELRTQTMSDYQTALASYNDFKTISAGVTRSSSSSDVDQLITAANTAAANASVVTNDLQNMMTQVNDKLVTADTVPAAFTTDLSAARSDASKANSDTSSSESAKESLESAEATLNNSGDVPLSIQTAQLALTKAENAVEDAEDTIADYSVVAPFSGTIAKVNVQLHDQAGGSTPVATLITNEEDAELSLNEVDAAKVKTGQKVALTFDAIDGLTLEGTVAEVDQVGTVTSGVVTYDVKISFDTQDARVKPGMTVNATITTASKDDALLVPASAVTTTGTQSFVQVVTMGAPAGASGTASTTGYRNHFASSTGEFASSTHQFGMNTTTPMFGLSSTSTSTAGFSGRASLTQTVLASSVTVTRVPVTLGLTSDTEAEIISGLTDGQMIVERTVTGTAATSAASATSATNRTTTARPGGFGGAAAVGGRGFGG